MKEKSFEKLESIIIPEKNYEWLKKNSPYVEKYDEMYKNAYFGEIKEGDIFYHGNSKIKIIHIYYSYGSYKFFTFPLNEIHKSKIYATLQYEAHFRLHNKLWVNNE